MSHPTRRIGVVAALAITASALATPTPVATASEAVPGSPFGPVTAAVAGHALRGVSSDSAPVAGRAADGGSIVFIKGGNVWLTRPDGSGMRRVTADGNADSPYEYPTMSSAGVIAVMKGDDIIRMKQSGAVLTKMTPEDLFVPDYGTITISPILDPEISPDGTKIAYSQVRLEHYGGGDYNYNVAEAATSVTDATRFTEPTKVYLGHQPGWIGNARFTVNRDGDVHLADLGQDAKPWFTSDDIFDRGPLDPFIALNEPEVSPDRQRSLVGIQGTGIAMTSTTSDPASGAPDAPTAAPLCFLTSEDPDVFPQDATFGPDSDSAVFSEGGKLSVVRNLAACNETTTFDVLTTGATEPDWSPAPLTAGGADGQTFTVVHAPAVTGTPKVGTTLKADRGDWSPAPATYVVTWLRNGKAVHSGTTYRLRAADRGQRIQVRVTAKKPGYESRSATSRAVKVRG